MRSIEAVYVLIVGPDGSGKSTLTREVTAALHVLGTPSAHLHFVPTDAAKDLGGEQHPHTLGARSIVPGVLSIIRRMFMYIRSMLVGHLNPAENRIVIHERGWMDQAADPLRYRLQSNLVPMVRLMYHVLRQPDLVILCDGDPHVMAKRKSELSEDEIEFQLAFWKWELRTRNTVTLDTTCAAPQEHAFIVVKKITDLRAERLKGRLRALPLVPRRLEMHSTGRAGSAVRALYRPASSRGLIARELAVAVHFLQGRTAGKEWAADILKAADRHAIEYSGVASIRSSGRNRWVVGLECEGKLVGVVKVSCKGDESLKREAVMLRELRTSATGFSVPVLLGFDESGYYSTLTMKAIASAGRRRSPTIRDVLDIAIGLARSRDGRGVTHGDLAPWNIIMGAPPYLVDWEAATDFRPGVDLAYYVVTLAALAKKLSVEDAAGLLGPESPLLLDFGTETDLAVSEVARAVAAYVSQLGRSNNRAAATARRISNRLLR